jgi:hypothetical protein
MTDDHDLRVDCAREFAKLSSGIQRAENGRRDQLDAIRGLSDSMAVYQSEVRESFGDIREQITTHLVKTEGRLSTLESQAESIDSKQKLVWGILIVTITTILGTIGGRLAGLL